MSKIPNFRAWYDNRMWCLAKLDLWGDPDQATCELAPYMPKYEELYDIYLSDVILMQSTGLKDKNGVEIYEGDWVQVEGMFPNEPFKVWYRNGMYHIGNWNLQGFMNTFDFYEVVGNIYENPDLLEV